MLRRLQDLLGQERARSNARAACTELSRRHVEQVEVDLFLERRAARQTGRIA
jgi:hypothetical protein